MDIYIFNLKARATVFSLLPLNIATTAWVSCFFCTLNTTTTPHRHPHTPLSPAAGGEEQRWLGGEKLNHGPPPGHSWGHMTAGQPLDPRGGGCVLILHQSRTPSHCTDKGQGGDASGSGLLTVLVSLQDRSVNIDCILLGTKRRQGDTHDPLMVAFSEKRADIFSI